MRCAPFLLAAALIVPCGAAAAQALAIYPAKGQSAARQARDTQACDTWAVKQTGFDPDLAQPPPHERGGAVRGALGGAAVGGIAGAIGDDVGKGAAIGGALGAAAGGIRQHRRNARAEAHQAQNLDAYNRAIAACLTGRGYTVR